MSKVAIMSDSHDQINNLEKALIQIRESRAEMLLHCGDLCAPFVVKRLAEAFSGAIHIVFGNNDGDGRLLQTVAAQYAHVQLHGIYVELTFANRQIAMIHYPEPARRIAQSGQFDLVCYGHNHLQNFEQIGAGFLINPGEVMGGYGAASWGLYDCASHQFKFQTIL